MCIFVLVILVLKEIIEYVFITRKGGNVINIEETQSNTKTNEIGTNTRFKKKKSGKDDKIIEGFAQCPSVSPIDTLTAPIESAAPPISNCERATWLFCDRNFDKLIAILNGGEFTDLQKQKLIFFADCMQQPTPSTYVAGDENNIITLDANLTLGRIQSSSFNVNETTSGDGPSKGRKLMVRNFYVRDINRLAVDEEVGDYKQGSKIDVYTSDQLAFSVPNGVYIWNKLEVNSIKMINGNIDMNKKQITNCNTIRSTLMYATSVTLRNLLGWPNVGAGTEDEIIYISAKHLNNWRSDGVVPKWYGLYHENHMYVKDLKLGILDGTQQTGRGYVYDVSNTSTAGKKLYIKT